MALTFLITMRCNLRCAYCDFTTLTGREMSSEAIIRSIEQFVRGGTVRVSISGGEPLLREDLGEILLFTREAAVISSLTTNGLLLEDRIDDMLLADFVFVTLEGGQKTHDRYRGGGSFETILRGVEGLRRRGRASGVIMPLHRNNYQEINEVIKITRSIGATVFFQPVQRRMDWRGERIDELSPDERISAFDAIMSAKRSGSPVGNSLKYLKMLSRGEKLSLPRCTAGRYFATVLPDGTLVPCCMLMGAHDFWPKVTHSGSLGAFNDLACRECDGCTISPYLETSFITSLDLELLWETARKLHGLLRPSFSGEEP